MCIFTEIDKGDSKVASDTSNFTLALMMATKVIYILTIVTYVALFVVKLIKKTKIKVHDYLMLASSIIEFILFEEYLKEKLSK